MEIIINLLSTNIEKSILFYTKIIGVFKIEYKSTNSSTLVFTYNEKVIITLNSAKNEGRLCDFSLQVPNTKKLYKHITKISSSSIVSDAYKFKDGDMFTFLEAPPGNYFYVIDPSGNKIQFFDKYEERVM